MIAGLGLAAEIANNNKIERSNYNQKIFLEFVEFLERNNFKIIGDKKKSCKNILLASHHKIDGEAIIIGLKDNFAISNGAACTSAKQRESHVLEAINLNKDYRKGVIRFSWSHLTKNIKWKELQSQISNFEI